jgi:hypothetical protein
LILLSISVGLAAGGLGWLAAGGASAAAEKLGPTEALVARLTRPHRTPGEVAPANITELSELPLLLLTTGPGATPLPIVQVDGLVSARGRRAALVSIDDKPSEWLVVGDIQRGVTLRDVAANHAVIETAYGLQDVQLGERSIAPPSNPNPTDPSPAAPTPAVARPSSTGPLTIPPGFRSPPPPASAPKAR